MNRILLISTLTLFAIAANANTHWRSPMVRSEIPIDSARLVELNRFWDELSRTVREGDFDGYKAANHEDAVVVFTASENKGSLLISDQLSAWKKDFTDARSGKRKNNVEFRFSQRIGGETTAHETGIFHFSSIDANGEFVADDFIFFEALLVKRNGKWLLMMEYQKAKATKKDWEALH